MQPDGRPSPEDVATQLGRLLASSAFANAGRMSRFLRYVVERTLAGEADSLKEYAIGVDVFDRDDRYDPRVDSIVRVEAARLRSKVEEYYNRDGIEDPVMIRLRRGTYVPVFETRRPAAAVTEPHVTEPSATAAARTLKWSLTLLTAGVIIVAALAWRAGLWTRGGGAPANTVAVLPLAHFSNIETEEMLSARLTDGITTELARLGTLHVVSHTSAVQFAGVRRPLREIARALNADFVMEGSVLTKSNRVHVSARLVEGATDQKIWVEDFDGSTSELPELQRTIAAAIAAALAKHPDR